MEKSNKLFLIIKNAEFWAHQIADQIIEHKSKMNAL